MVAACSAVIALIILLVNIKRPHKPTFASVQAAEAAAAEGSPVADEVGTAVSEATGAEAAAAEASEEAGAGSTASESAPGGDPNE